MAILALIVWPLSFVWVPNAGHNPDAVRSFVLLIEIAAILLAVAAIWLGTLVTRDGENTPASDRGGRLAMLVVVLVVAGNLLGQALLR
jgi:heme A synthase